MSEPDVRKKRQEPEDGRERIAKILSNFGVCSRRAAEKLIGEGRVSLNGSVVLEVGSKADTGTDIIAVDGEQVATDRSKRTKEYRYLLFNKPPGLITTCSDPFGRKTIFDALKLTGRFFPVGRLDCDSRGLIIITNDGAMCDLILHPRNGIEKTYIVRVSHALTSQMSEALIKGVDFKGESYRAESVERISESELEKIDSKTKTPVPARIKNLKKKGLNDPEGGALYKVVLSEGKKREIRRMMIALGSRVLDLYRIAIGPLSVKGIDEGSYRDISSDELKKLKEIIGYARQ